MHSGSVQPELGVQQKKGRGGSGRDRSGRWRARKDSCNEGLKGGDGPPSLPSVNCKKVNVKSGRDWTSTSSGSNATTTATRNAFATTDTTTTGRRLMQPTQRLSAVANARRRRWRRRGMMWANNRDRVDEGQRPSPRLAPGKTDRPT